MDVARAVEPGMMAKRGGLNAVIDQAGPGDRVQWGRGAVD